MSFADNLQYLRKKNKTTQEELAEELSVSRQSVSKWETGEAYPETEKLIALCDKFGVTLDDLMRGDVTHGAPANSVEEESVNADILKEESVEQPAQKVDEGSMPQNGCCSSCGEHRMGKLGVIGTAISSAAMIICVVVYLCLGFTLDLWHPTWLVFLGGILVCIWSGGLTDESGKSTKEKIGGMVCGTTMVSAVIIFLAIGFTLKIWHPTWVVFIIGAGICAVVGAFTGKKQ